MKVLEGVTVVDFTQAYSGPFSTMQLADFGARVIKIEERRFGDAARYWAPIDDKGESGYFASMNRGKEDITIDFTKPEGKEIVMKLVEKADILVENFKVGTLAKNGLGYEEVKKVNPEIIYASLSGYGQDGAWKPLAAYDNIIQAQCGIMEMTGEADSVPTKVGVSVGDSYTGINMSFAITMAYLNKLRTGKGQFVDVAMFDTLFGIMESPIMTKELTGDDATRCGNTDPTLFPYDVYPCKDGYFSAGIPSGSKKEWKAFCEAIGREDLFEKEEYLDNQARVDAYDVLTPELNKFFETKTKAELTKIFNEAGIPNSPVRTLPELMVDPQLKARDMLVEIDDQNIGRYTAPGNPMKLDKTPAVIGKGSPKKGEHNESVLKELGYSDDDIKTFIDNEVI